MKTSKYLDASAALLKKGSGGHENLSEDSLDIGMMTQEEFLREIQTRHELVQINR